MLKIPQLDRRPNISSRTSFTKSEPNRRAPIHRLPPEILGLIFWNSISCKSDFVEPSIRTAPLLLGRVCKYWRDLAERTPELWSSISLFLLRPYELATRAFERWISRSGSCPLRIKIVVLTYSVADARVSAQPLWEFIRNIASQSHRWFIADIAVPGVFMQSLLANEAPILRRLTLADPLAEATSDLHRRWEHTFALTAAPALCQLILKQRLRLLPSPRHSVTSIQFDAFSSSQVIEILDGCPLIEELGITFKLPILVKGGPDVWTFPHMHTLRISLHIGNSRESSSFLERLALPILRTLTIDGLRQAHGLHLSTLLSRTSGGLESLSLLNISTSNSDMFEYLHRSPLLHTLRLVDSHGFDNRCLRRLTWLSGWIQPNICPHLRELWLLRSECQMLGREYVENMIASRTPGGSNARVDRSDKEPDPLMEFRFDGSKYQHEDLLNSPRIKRAIEKGLIWKR